MRLFIMASFAGLLAAGSAVAQDRLSDQDYLRQARCAGLAAGLGHDADAHNARLREAGAGRAPLVLQLAQRRQSEARRHASRGDERRTADLQREFDAHCQAG